MRGWLREDQDAVKGYERGPGDYVILEGDELEAVALDSNRTIDIEVFTPRNDIETIWLDKPHYMTPDDPVAEEAFCVIRDAMASTGMAGVSRLVMYRRERAVMLEPRDKGIVLWTLRYGDEVRDPTAYFAGDRASKPDSDLLKLVTRLIDEKQKRWTSAMVCDPVQERLLDIIASKKAPRPKVKRAKPHDDPSGKVINIMDALRRSLDENGRGKRR